MLMPTKNGASKESLRKYLTKLNDPLKYVRGAPHWSTEALYNLRSIQRMPAFMHETNWPSVLGRQAQNNREADT